MKGKVSYTLDLDVIRNVRKAADDDGRTASNWLNRRMKVFFEEHSAE